MTVVTLHALLDARDESLAIRRTRPAWLTRAWAWLRGVDVRTPAARVGVVALFLVAFLNKHALVLGGLVTFVVAASLFSTVAGWVMAGVSLLFLEVRRR